VGWGLKWHYEAAWESFLRVVLLSRLSVSLKIRASCQTRHGDWVMRMRFQGENTRETKGSERQRL